MGNLIPVAAVMSLLASMAVGADDVVIVRDGKTDFAIVLPDRPTDAESLAAAEFAKYVRAMTGVAIPVEGTGQHAKQIRISETGRSTKQRDPIHPDAYALRVSDDRIEIEGASGHAVLHGVYALLDGMGCRFLAPTLDHYNGLAEVIPKSPTLAVPRDRWPDSWIVPAFKFRKLYVEEGISHDADNLKQIIEWMPKVGYNTLVIPTDYQGHGRVKWDTWRTALTPELQKRGIFIEVGGHGYQNFLNPSMEGGTLLQKHPEYFGQDASGKRLSDNHSVFCTSNQDAVRYVIANFLAYIKDRPEIQLYDFWPPDGAKWCECDKCKFLGTPSDRQAILLDQVKDAVSPVRPDLRLEMIAYSSYIAPPEGATVDRSVLVDFCPINQSFNWQIDDPASDRNAGYARDLAAWRSKFAGDISIYSYYRKYAWDSLPVVIPHYMQRDLQWYAKLPVQGVSTYAEPGDWFTYELNYYTLAALAWDPNADIDAVVKKFAVARYGPAAASHAITAYSILEDVVRTTCTVPFTPKPTAAAIRDATARLDKAAAVVNAAIAAATDDGVKHNFARLLLMVDYARGDLEAQSLLLAGDKPAARARAIALHTWAKSHAADGTFLIVRNRLNQARMLKRIGITGAATAPAVPE